MIKNILLLKRSKNTSGFNLVLGIVNNLPQPFFALAITIELSPRISFVKLWILLDIFVTQRLFSVRR